MAEINDFPKASAVTIRKVGGGFILAYEVPASVSNLYALQQAQAVAGIAMAAPTRTVEHVVPDQTSLGAALARLLRE